MNEMINQKMNQYKADEQKRQDERAEKFKKVIYFMHKMDKVLNNFRKNHNHSSSFYFLKIKYFIRRKYKWLLIRRKKLKNFEINLQQI